MNYLMEFAKNEPMGFCIFIFCVVCLGIAIWLLIVRSDTGFYSMVPPPPPRPRSVEKTDFSEMCHECFSSTISKMPLRTICDFREVERQRIIGCSHGAEPYKKVDNSDLNELLEICTKAVNDSDDKSKIKISTKGIDSSELIKLLPLIVKLVSIVIDKQKPTGPPNTKLNGDPLDKKAVKS